MELEQYLTDLGNEEKPIRQTDLLQLSGLSTEELSDFKSVWLSLPQSRKCEILGRLEELSEDNLDLEFIAVFRSCLADEHDEVRERAARGLWECDDRIIIRPMITLLLKDASPNVRAIAAASLGRFAEMAQEGKILDRDGDRVRDALLSVIHDEEEDGDVRRRAIESVASFNSPEVESIVREAYFAGDPMLKRTSLYAMGRSSDDRWIPLIVEEMMDQDPAVRYEAAIAYGKLDDESTVPQVITLLNDEDFQVQMAAIQALGNIGGSLAKRALLQCLQMEDESMEQAAKAALQIIEFDEDPLGYRFEA